MKRLALLTLLPTLAFAESTFTEIRLGLEDNYRKEVKHQTKGTLAGNFKGMNYGLRIGNTFGQHQLYLEYNPNQEVEIKSANELAHVQSTFIGYRYFIKPEFFLGAQIGQSSFELEKGPNGVTFTDNPKTSGTTYGINLGYRHNLASNFYLQADATYNFGSYKEDGPSTTPVNTIEIQNQSQINVSLGMSF